MATLGLLLGGSLQPARAAGDRLAVLIVADRDPDLSDNLTEVAISKLAERREHRLVGWRELHEQLPDILAGRGIADCLDNPECLGRLGAAAHVDSALIGEVRQENDRFVVHMVLVDTSTAIRGAEFSESGGLDVAQLISIVRRGAGMVSAFKPARPSRPAAAAQVALQPAPPPIGSPIVAATPPPPRRARWIAPVGYAAGGLAVVSLSAAVVTGTIGSAAPTGMTRAEAQSDLDRRDRYAGIANGLYVTAGALALSAIVLLISQLRHQERAP